jgi:transposase
MGQHFDRPSRAALRARAAVVAPLVAQGLTPTEIERQTGISHQWIADWRRRSRADEGVRLQGRDARARVALDARRVAALQAYENGMLQAEIARRWHVSRAAVAQWVKAGHAPDGVTRRGRSDAALDALETRRVAAMQAYEAGMGQADIARRWHVSAATVCRWVQALTRGGESALRRAATTGRPPRKATP